MLAPGTGWGTAMSGGACGAVEDEGSAGSGTGTGTVLGTASRVRPGTLLDLKKLRPLRPPGGARNLGSVGVGTGDEPAGSTAGGAAWWW